METKAQLIERLQAACRRLGTSPQRWFEAKAWNVGNFPPNRPYPAVESLAPEQLYTLAGLAEQAVNLGGASDVR